MGIGGGQGEWDDYEWIRLDAWVPSDDPAEENPDALEAALAAWLTRHPAWTDRALPRVLLVDLDNLRADPARWKVRMAAMVALARQADHASFAGQRGAVRRAKPRLAEFASSVQAVPDGSDLADHALLDAADALGLEAAQVAVVSNDNIFAELAEGWSLTVVTPGRAALSAKLRQVADRLLDLESLEEAALAVPASRKAATGTATSRKTTPRKTATRKAATRRTATSARTKATGPRKAPAGR
ncbi:MAG TPA: hypothetical protein VF364_01630 [Candidatus Limnocylindria bacterium]